jgi:hypothetical protein
MDSVNGIMDSNQGEYYRLIFEAKANQDTDIITEVSKASDVRKLVKVVHLEKSDEYMYEEITFSTDDKYLDLVFSKKNKKDRSRVAIRNVNISKLDISSEKDFEKIRPTLIGRVDISGAKEKQTDSSIKYSQLRNENTLLGQIFKAESDYISGIAFDIDITRGDNRGGRKYKLDLREADFDGEVYTVSKNSVASMTFTVSGLESYRQDDGKIRFPIFSFLKKGSYYFAGIDNQRVKTDKFNHLTLKGSTDDKYQDGTAVVKKSGDTLRINGDLYFVAYGAEFTKYGEERILTGAVIEDIGNGNGIFIYKAGGRFRDFVDLYSSSPDVKFDNERGVIAGMNDQDSSSFVYRLNTIYPFRRMNIRASQPEGSASRSRVYYSFDQADWSEIPFSLEAASQKFDFSFDGYSSKKEVYVKIVPLKQSSDKAGSYGLRNFEARADLVIK